jgi:imidazolonepropionase-like amidohydrolase
MNAMGFCEHCEGQRFDRAQVLRILRATRKTVRKHSRADEALRLAIEAVRALEIPHLERLDETSDEPMVH